MLGVTIVGDYAGMAGDRAALKAYLDGLAAVSEADSRRWPKVQRLAFPINAYNGWTVELILGGYPDLKWRRTVVTLTSMAYLDRHDRSPVGPSSRSTLAHALRLPL